MARDPIEDRIAANKKRAGREGFTLQDLVGMIGWLDRGRSRFEKDIRSSYDHFLDFIETLEVHIDRLNSISQAKFYRTAGQYAEAAATDKVSHNDLEGASGSLSKSERYLHTARHVQPTRDHSGAFYGAITEGLLSRVNAEQALVLGSFSHEPIGAGALSFIKYVTHAQPYAPKLEDAFDHLKNARVLHANAGSGYGSYGPYLDSLEGHLNRISKL